MTTPTVRDPAPQLLRIRWNRFAFAVIFWVILLAIAHALLADSSLLLLDNLAVAVVGAATDTLVALWRHRPLDRVARWQATALGTGTLVFWCAAIWLERHTPESENWVVAGGIGVAIGSLPFRAIGGGLWARMRRRRV